MVLTLVESPYFPNDLVESSNGLVCSSNSLVGSKMVPSHRIDPINHVMLSLHSTTGFYMAKLDEICYRVCSSGFSDVYETIQNPEFQNPAIGGI